MAETWTPPRSDWLPPKAKDCAERWPEGAYETEAEAFRCYWQGESGPRAKTFDWNKRWAKHVVRETSRIVRDAKVVNYSSNRTESLTALVNDIATIGPNGRRSKEEVEAVEEEEGEAEAIRRHLKHRIGDASFRSWFSQCDIEVQGGEVVIQARSNVIADGIRDRFAADVRRACVAVLGSRFSGLDVPSVARAVTPFPRRSGWQARLG